MTIELVRPSIDDLWTRDVMPVCFRAGAWIFREGDDASGWYRISTGKVRVGRSSVQGQSCLFDVFGPADVFGEDALLDGGPRTTHAIATTEVRAVRMDRRVLHARLLDDPSTAEYLLRLMARRVRHTTDNVADLMSGTVACRVAKHLLQLAERFGLPRAGQRGAAHPLDGVGFRLDLTQEQFAQLVGTSRESLNKTLNEFVDDGCIRVSGDEILVVDAQPLVERTSVRRLGAARQR